jgi:hypothetical protein
MPLAAEGREVVGIAQAMVPEVERRINAALGADRVRALHEDLEDLEALRREPT